VIHIVDKITIKERANVVREILRRYLELKQHFVQYGKYTIKHRGLEICFLDFQGCLKALSPRKKEAVFYTVINDMMQKDAAAIMGITSASVGLYVRAATEQIAEEMWGPVEE